MFSFIKIQQWKAIERHGPKEEKNLWDEFLSHIGYSMGKKKKDGSVLFYCNSITDRWGKKFSQSEEKTTQDKKEPKNCVHVAFLLKPLLIK